MYFSSSVPAGAETHQVLRDGGELRRFAQSAAPRDGHAATAIVAAADRTDFTSRVLVGRTRTTGCSQATAASLAIAGDRLSLQVRQPKPAAECLTAFHLTVVFGVPAERIPAHPVFD
ncbi:hypothetical protein [Streptomyces sp. CA-111067]|uniref:hypothetical protein n=1 Tax=Streptomyces sp. CA-111067 TaxID=3240046 RepID=UPI003D95D97E